MNSADFIELVGLCLDEVGPHYFGREYLTDQMQGYLGIDQDDPRLPALQDHLRRFGERVFCYQLYHRLQQHLEEEGIEEGGPILQGELKKDDIRAILELMPDDVQPLEGEYIPDFLYHSPVNFDHQISAIEVKTRPAVEFRELHADLKKLSELATRYRYETGLLLIINSDPGRIRDLLRAHSEELHGLDLPDRIRIMVKEHVDADFWEASLEEILA